MLKHRICILICATAIGALLLAACSADGESLYKKRCEPCHTTDLDTIVTLNAPNYATSDDWRALVADMQAKTTTISDDEADAIAQYLFDSFSADE